MLFLTLLIHYKLNEVLIPIVQYNEGQSGRALDKPLQVQL